MNWLTKICDALVEGRRRQAEYMVQSMGGTQAIPLVVEEKPAKKPAKKKAAKKTAKKPAKKAAKKPAKSKKTES